jgi:hypothetical protein
MPLISPFLTTIIEPISNWFIKSAASLTGDSSFMVITFFTRALSKQSKTNKAESKEYQSLNNTSKPLALCRLNQKV